MQVMTRSSAHSESNIIIIHKKFCTTLISALQYEKRSTENDTQNTRLHYCSDMVIAPFWSQVLRGHTTLTTIHKSL